MLPNVAQKTACTQNVTMDVIFDLRYGPAFNDVNLLRNPWKYAKILFMRFLNTMYLILTTCYFLHAACYYLLLFASTWYLLLATSYLLLALCYLLLAI